MTDERSSGESVDHPPDPPGTAEVTDDGSEVPDDAAAREPTGSGTEDGAAGPGRDVPDAAESREVVVPLRVYKTVTVFSTLLAVVAVVGGFVFLDRATNKAQAASVDPVFGIVGIALILAGAGVYAFSTRFRAAGMGKSKDDAAEDSGNG